MIAAAHLPLRSDPANNQLERPSAQGLRPHYRLSAQRRPLYIESVPSSD